MSSIVHANEWHEKRFVIHQFQFFKTNSRLIQTYFHINSKQVQHFSLYCRHFSAERLKVLWSWSTVCSAPVWTWHTLRRSWCCGDSPFWRQQLGAQLTTWIASTTGNSCLETPWDALRCLESHRKLGKNWDKADHLQSFFAKQILLSIWIRNADSKDTDVYAVTAEQECQITMGFSCGAHEDFSKRSWGLSG